MSDVHEDSLIILRKPGRPRSPEPRSSVSTWIPTKDHDLLIKLANAGGMSVSQLVGQMVAQQVRPRKSGL